MLANTKINIMETQTHITTVIIDWTMSPQVCNEWVDR